MVAANDKRIPTESLYAAHEKIYPREMKGRFQRWRHLNVIVILVIYYGLPWLNWHHHQAILFDLPARQFYIFGITFWPQDFYYLTWLLIIAALSLFLVTAIAGRIWCGYSCPQTVWTEAFLWLERITEGHYRQRIKLDQSPWTPEKFFKKFFKQCLWISFALWTGFTFVGYFTPIKILASQLSMGALGGWEWFWSIFYSFATYGNAGFLREQVCKYMCPYARFQSAMFDKETLIVSYDAARGEPRGSRKRTEIATNLGSCIDCQMCVQVCPTGIDIRDGLQYECIGCAACIDACDSVMDHMGYARGLVKYTSENSLTQKKTRVLRPRIIIYTSVWLALCSTFFLTIYLRTPLAVDVLRDRNALYQQSDQGIDNIYTLKIMNKDHQAHTYTIQASGLDSLSIISNTQTPMIAAGEVFTLPLRIRVKSSAIHQPSNTIHIRVQTADKTIFTTETTLFWAPFAWEKKS